MLLKRICRPLAVALTATLVLSAAVPAAATEENSQLHTLAETYSEVPSEETPSEQEKPSTEMSGNASSEKPSTETSGEHDTEKPSAETPGEHDTEKPSAETSGEHDTEKPSTEISGEHDTEKPSTETSGEYDTEKPSTETPGEHDTEKPSTETSGEHASEMPSTEIPGIDLPDINLPALDPNPGTESEAGNSENTPDNPEELPEIFPGEELGEDPNFNLGEEITEEENLLNEGLVQAQHITMPELTELREEFRFTRDDSAIRVVLKKGARVYDDTVQTAQVIGRSYTGSIAYILDTLSIERVDLASGETLTEKWYYIESGSVRGYVPEAALITGLDAAEILLDQDAVERFRDAECTVRPVDNQALTHIMKTAYEPVVEKVYAIAASNLSVLSEKNPSGEDVQVIGNLPKGGLAYILADADSEMVFVESGDVRGFVPAAELITGDQADATVKKQGEGGLKQAVEKAAPSDNPALYYTLTSIKQADGNAALRKAMVEYALQFQGNPYVWGGTSLTNGTDCSGFVMQIYKQFGYSLPRTSGYQSQFGMQIPVSAAIPGDLIFFAKDGLVHHVAMYIGNGKMIHAKGQAYGIVVDNVSLRAVWATRIIK